MDATSLSFLFPLLLTFGPKDSYGLTFKITDYMHFNVRFFSSRHFSTYRPTFARHLGDRPLIYRVALAIMKERLMALHNTPFI
jgi:hypothetical protein